MIDWSDESHLLVLDESEIADTWLASIRENSQVQKNFVVKNGGGAGQMPKKTSIRTERNKIIVLQ